MPSSTHKLTDVLACPNCKTRISLGPKSVTCTRCGSSYEVLLDTPILIKQHSPILEWYKPQLIRMESKRLARRLVRNLRGIYSSLKPSDRVWTRRSQKVIQKMLEEKTPDAADRYVVLIGAGFEPVYRHLLRTYKSIIRVGLPTAGTVNAICDVCDLPFVENSLDLIFSSSVLEHVYNPERAIDEMRTALKPGGYVYAEIPFMRAYHMIPVDYQRYTLSGIEELFKRHGFAMLDKGICSGPFTGFVLFLIDFCGSVFSFNKYLRAIIDLALSIVLHPVKYLDRFCENAKWAEISSCNFYYLGVRIQHIVESIGATSDH